MRTKKAIIVVCIFMVLLVGSCADISSPSEESGGRNPDSGRYIKVLVINNSTENYSCQLAPTEIDGKVNGTTSSATIDAGMTTPLSIRLPASWGLTPPGSASFQFLTHSEASNTTKMFAGWPQVYNAADLIPELNGLGYEDKSLPYYSSYVSSLVPGKNLGSYATSNGVNEFTENTIVYNLTISQDGQIDWTINSLTVIDE